MQEAHSIGSHSVAFDGDIIRITYVGDYSGEEAVEFTRLCSLHAASYPRFFALVEPSRVGHVSSEARKVWIDWFRKHSFEAIVCVGSVSFATRTMIRLVVSASRILLRRDPVFVFMPTEIEALAWINRRRAIE